LATPTVRVLVESDQEVATLVARTGTTPTRVGPARDPLARALGRDWRLGLPLVTPVLLVVIGQSRQSKPYLMPSDLVA
jgi:hypothetical protein